MGTNDSNTLTKKQIATKQLIPNEVHLYALPSIDFHPFKELENVSAVFFEIVLWILQEKLTFA